MAILRPFQVARRQIIPTGDLAKPRLWVSGDHSVAVKIPEYRLRKTICAGSTGGFWCGIFWVAEGRPFPS